MFVSIGPILRQHRDGVEQSMWCAAQTKVTNSQRYQTASNASPSFLVDFGKRVLELDPTRLFIITGTDRTDVAYDVNTGRIFITAYVPDQTLRTTIT